jgi:hypothetical protein
MAAIKVFLSHDSRDSDLAGVLGRTLSRVTLGQIEPWFSSDGSAGGGLRPGSIWLDDIRKRLQDSKAVVALLTPRSLLRPWLLFETGFAAANAHCEVIPVAVGVDSLNAVPFPLAMYQVFQISDYDALKKFTAKVLSQYGIQFDEEMAKPVLQASMGEFARLASGSVAAEESQPRQADIVEAVKQQIDRAFLRLSALIISGDIRTTLGEGVYSIAIHLPGKDASAQFLEISTERSVQNVLDNVYYMLRPQMQPFQYLSKWLLRERGTNINLVLREVGSRVPASSIFRPGSEWEVVPLDRPYRPGDSQDSGRWYQG